MPVKTLNTPRNVSTFDFDMQEFEDTLESDWFPLSGLSVVQFYLSDLSGTGIYDSANLFVFLSNDPTEGDKKNWRKDFMPTENLGWESVEGIDTSFHVVSTDGAAFVKIRVQNLVPGSGSIVGAAYVVH